MYINFLLIVAVFLLSSCDFYLGVSRSCPASQIPELGCVERVIKSVPKAVYFLMISQIILVIRSEYVSTLRKECPSLL